MPYARRQIVRSLLLGGALLPLAGRDTLAQAGALLKGDDGRPAQTLRLPGELTGDLDQLPGVLWVGAASRAVTLYEFFDYNCPYCRVAVKDMHQLLKKAPVLRLGLVNNAILSPMSAQVAKVHLALLQLQGPAIADQFHQRMLAMPGTNDGPRALKVAAEFGARRAQVEEVADGDAITAQLKGQITTAANLGLAATPSFVAGNTGVFGYPGPRALAQVVKALDACGDAVCPT